MTERMKLSEFIRKFISGEFILVKKETKHTNTVTNTETKITTWKCEKS